MLFNRKFKYLGEQNFQNIWNIILSLVEFLLKGKTLLITGWSQAKITLKIFQIGRKCNRRRFGKGKDYYINNCLKPVFGILKTQRSVDGFKGIMFLHEKIRHQMSITIFKNNISSWSIDSLLNKKGFDQTDFIFDI